MTRGVVVNDLADDAMGNRLVWEERRVGRAGRLIVENEASSSVMGEPEGWRTSGVRQSVLRVRTNEVIMS